MHPIDICYYWIDKTSKKYAEYYLVLTHALSIDPYFHTS